MKRIRLVGVATIAPAFALGLAAPGALAAADHPNPSRDNPAPGKSVRVLPGLGHAAPAAAYCSYPIDHRLTQNYGSNGYAEISHNGGLLCDVSAHLLGSQRNLEMRIRVYRGPGAKNGIYSHLQHGGIANGSTYFSHYMSSLAGGTAVCLALVNSRKTTSVKYGPDCFNY